VTAREYRTPAGAILEPNGDIRFRLWAPGAESVGLFLDGGRAAFSMWKTSDGWHELLTHEAKPGSLYQYVLPDGMMVPDPASRFQPDDVHGPSEVIDPVSYDWTVDWAGRDWDDVVLYEIHIGAFTAEGTFRAAIEKLDHLAWLGVTAIEIMPVSDFPGRRNWGYDGVLLYAPDSSYGRPEDFKALVEAAHARGIAVLLDVVYSHFGPEGNYLPLYAPAFFTELRHTPWGAAINYDGCGGKPVREFVIHNALYWLEEFNLDGLRVDAAHAIIDEGAKHLLDELVERQHLTAPDLIKIDIEGGEALALAGMSAGLRRGRYRRLLLELHPVQLAYHGSNPTAIIEGLLEMGYRAWVIAHSAADVRRAAYAHWQPVDSFPRPLRWPESLGAWPHLIFALGHSPVFPVHGRRGAEM